MTLFTLAYSTLTRTTLLYLDCVPIELAWGIENRLFLDGDIICNQPWQHFLYAMVIVILAPLPFLVIAFRYYLNKSIPKGFVVRKSAKKAMLDVFEGPYRINRKYWESVILLRKFILNVFYSLINDPFLKAFLLAMGCIIILIMHIVMTPFSDKYVQSAEAVSLFMLLVLSIMNIRFGTLVATGVEDTNALQATISIIFEWFAVTFVIIALIYLTYIFILRIAPGMYRCFGILKLFIMEKCCKQQGKAISLDNYSSDYSNFETSSEK